LHGRGLVAATNPPRLTPGPGRSILYSSSMWFCGGSPTHALGTAGVSRAYPETPTPLRPRPCRHAPEDVLHAAALAEERVHHRAARRHERRLEQEAEQRQHRVEALRLGVAVRAEAHALAQLGQQHQVQHDGRGQQRVLRGAGSRPAGGGAPQATPTAPPPHLARVVQHQRVGPAQHQLRRVLVQRPLAVPHVGHVLDDHLRGRSHVARVPRAPSQPPAPHGTAPRTQWSGFSPGAYSTGLLCTMSSTTLLLDTSLERNCCGADRLRPSLLPRWL
jgi:hypothetical protein